MKRNFYLQHPLMAMHDPRMQYLLKMEKLKGTGAYWFVIEKLAMLPGSCVDMEFLRPYCKMHKISFAYVKKIILAAVRPPREGSGRQFRMQLTVIAEEQFPAFFVQFRLSGKQSLDDAQVVRPELAFDFLIRQRSAVQFPDGAAEGFPAQGYGIRKRSVKIKNGGFDHQPYPTCRLRTVQGESRA